MMVLVRAPAVPLLALLAAGAACASGSGPAEPTRPPNVLFISVDDLNDWIEPLGGHPQALTPNLTRLARQSVLFTRAYAASPSCNPSRTALLTGRHTYTTGMYSNYQYWREVLPEAVTLPRHFADAGWFVAGAGKIFHNDQPDPDSWDDYFPSKEEHMPDYARPVPEGPVNMPAFEDMYSAFDWGPLDLPDSETGDARSVEWIIERLREEREEPFFLAAGIYRPHLPWYVPKRWFDLFPLESVQLPRLLTDDLADVPERGLELAHRGGDYHAHVVAAGQWRRAVQGYLASIAYADALVGRLLDAVESSGHAEDTIVVLWSDHGWQLGEKQHWRKFALWENLARVVLMIRVPERLPGLPGGAPAGARSPRIVSLLDLYPTLIELAGAPERPGLDGRSLVALLADPLAAWDHPAITTYDFGEFSVRSERWRYIRYIDGSEELYDHASDPEEWKNLAGRREYAAVIAELARHIPERPAPLAETSYELGPHHSPPLRSVEDWRRRREGRPPQ